MPTSAKDRATAYAQAVVDGEIVSGRLVLLACERHLRDLETGELRGIYFDVAESERSIDFFRFLSHSKGEWGGQPIELDPWQCFIIGSMFGWKRAIDGLRRFRVIYIAVARKNGKTTITAGVGLRLAFFDDEPGAEVYTGATTEKQAKICFDEARRMVLRSPLLSPSIQAFVGNLSNDITAQKMEPLPNEPDRQDGLNPHGGLIDEYHAHPTSELADVLESGTAARRQPMMVYTTTAGSNAESPCRALDSDVQNILEGHADDDSVFGYIARIDDDDRWDDESVWIKANPGLGVSVKLDDLQGKCRRAQRNPRLQNEFIRKHCNRWTQQAQRWISMEAWDACPKECDPDELRGLLCFGGLDLSSTTDLTAFVAEFPLDGGRVKTLARFWIPKDNIAEKSRIDGVNYADWVKRGLVVATPGNIVDYDVIREDLRAFAGLYQLREIAYDRWNATQLATQLMQDGATMVPFAQGYSAMSEPSKYLEALVESGRLNHGGNAVLRWMASNVATTEGPNESIRPVKPKGETGKRIDGIVAMVMALGRLIIHQAAASQTSVYEHRGLRVF